MEDDSLDDFFAKKDKSKKKGKAKVTPGDILAKQEEKPKKKPKPKKEEKATPVGQEAGSEDRPEKETKATPQPPDEEEWADYEAEEKDYTGLRIQNMQIRDENSDDDNDKRDSGDEEGEEGERGEGSRGPWNKGSQQQQQNATAVQQEEETPPAEPKPAEPPKEETPAKTQGKYVPPGARGGQSSMSSSGPTPLRRGGGGKKNAPNLQSEEDFPTLGGAIPTESQESNLSSFERVRGGGRQMEDERSKGIKLQLGNKFASLGE